MQHVGRYLVAFASLAGCADEAAESSRTTVAPTVVSNPIELVLSGAEPVIPHGLVDSTYLLAGASTRFDDMSHLWVVAFAQGGGASPRIRHLTSTDGLTWTPDAKPVEVDDQLGFDDIGPIPSSVLVDDDGTWLMYGGGRLDGTSRQIIWRATAPGPDGPWQMHPEPVLAPADTGWDTELTDHPSVVRTADGYLMAYGGAGRGQRNRNRIGVARSADGIDWIRQLATLPEADDSEALGPFACGMAARTMFEPELIEVATGFRLLFGVMVGDDMLLGAADSSDGRTWTCAIEGTVLQPTQFGTRSTGLHSYVVVRGDPAGSVLVEVLSGDASDLWLVVPS